MSALNRTFILSGDGPAQALWSFLRQNWRAMCDQGKALAVTVTEAKSKRSLEQNARYFGFLLKHVTEQSWVSGQRYSKTAWHEYFARKYVGIEKLPNGEITAISTTTLNVEQFAEFMNEVEAEAVQELGVQFPS